MSALFAALLIAFGPGQGGGATTTPPEAMAPGGTGADVRARWTLMFELDESVLRSQEGWQLSNDSPRRIEAESLVFRYPSNVKQLTFDDKAKGFEVVEGQNMLRATKALGSGQIDLATAFFTEHSGGSAELKRLTPVNIESGRVIIETLPGSTVEANFPLTSRVADLNGIQFTVYEFGGLPAGTMMEIKVRGLPGKSTLPRTIAALLSGLLVLLTVYAVVNRRTLRTRAEARFGALSAQARRDQIVKALEILERDLRTDAIKEKRYQRRHAELMTELAVVLREIELARSLANPESAR